MMMKRSILSLNAGRAGDSAASPIPMVERRREDPRNILGVINIRDADKGQYKIAVKAGILKGLLSRNKFHLCPQRLLTETDVNPENSISLRTTVITDRIFIWWPRIY